jgi:hypothetical protein
MFRFVVIFLLSGPAPARDLGGLLDFTYRSCVTFTICSRRIGVSPCTYVVDWPVFHGFEDDRCVALGRRRDFKIFISVPPSQHLCQSLGLDSGQLKACGRAVGTDPTSPAAVKPAIAALRNTTARDRGLTQ